MHGHSLAEYMRCIDRDDWRCVGELMLSSAHKLAKAGADFLICPDNTVHQALPDFLDRSPLPWLHIAEVVAGEAASRGFRRVGLSGTRYLVESDVYPEKLTARGGPFEGMETGLPLSIVHPEVYLSLAARAEEMLAEARSKQASQPSR